MGSLGSQTLGNIPIIHDKEYDELDDAQGANWASTDVFKTFKIADCGNLYIIQTAGGEFRIVDTAQVFEEQTIDATITDLMAYTTQTDYIYHVEAVVMGTVNTGGNGATYKLIGSFKNDSGTLTQIGTTTSTHTAEDAGAWAATLNTDTLAIDLRVTGAAGTVIDWVGYVKIYAVKNS